MNPQNVRPRYEVEKVDDTVMERRIARKPGPGGGSINYETTVEVPYGFNVYFPAGHSIRVATEEELHRLGFDVPADLIDTETGDTVGTTAQMTLKRQTLRRAGAPKRSDTGAVDANQGG